MYMDLITYIPGFFFVLFLGSWSDKHGRKLPMLLPICGNFVAALIYLGNAFWMQLPSQYMLLAAIPRAMTGGGSTLFMACFSYMADISRVRSRTMRIAFMDFGFVLGPLVGLLSSDILFYKTGYLGVYGVSALFYLLALVYGIIRIVDTRGRFSPYHQQTTELSYQPGNMCLDLFDTENIKDTFRTATKPRPNKGRTKIFLLMSVMCTLLFVYVGSIDLLYTKLKFGWDYNQYIQLKVAELLLSLTGTTIVLPLFSFHLNIDDSLLGMVGAVSSIGGAVIRGLATQPWMLFFSYVVSCLGGMPLITTRSIMSKCVPDVELGKVFSMLASWESIIPLLSSPLFTLVYNATITTFPGTVYFLGACFYTLAFMIYVWLFVNRKPLPAPGHIHEENIPETED